MAELEQVHSQTLDQRLASFLLVHAQEGGAVHKTQQEIAGHIGATREVVARLLGRMVKQGWIETGRGSVRILKRPHWLRWSKAEFLTNIVILGDAFPFCFEVGKA